MQTLSSVVIVCVQMKERLAYVLQQQPERQIALAMGLSSKHLVLMTCNRQGVTEHTPFIGIHWLNSADDGWQVRNRSRLCSNAVADAYASCAPQVMSTATAEFGHGAQLYCMTSRTA